MSRLAAPHLPSEKVGRVRDGLFPESLLSWVHVALASGPLGHPEPGAARRCGREPGRSASLFQQLLVGRGGHLAGTRVTQRRRLIIGTWACCQTPTSGENGIRSDLDPDADRPVWCGVVRGHAITLHGCAGGQGRKVASSRLARAT